MKAPSILENQVYLSVASLSFNDACRAAMIDAIFFSKQHTNLRSWVVGENLFTHTFAMNPLLVPNGPNDVRPPMTTNLFAERLDVE